MAGPTVALLVGLVLMVIAVTPMKPAPLEHTRDFGEVVRLLSAVVSSGGKRPRRSLPE